MPIYEFVCVKCNKILSFFSRRVNVETLPKCPHCGEPLSRQVSHFATPRAGDYSDALGDAPMDDDRVINAVDQLRNHLDAVNGEDPQAVAARVREFSEASGLQFNRDLQEAIQRIEKGDDPEKVGAEMDEIIGTGEGTFAPGDRGRNRQKAPPLVRDETLYDL